MKSSAPWSVKGIERDARETAKEAARREGMTVGEWLNQMIYSAGDAAPSDGEIEGLKLRDLVTAIEHLHKRIAKADAKSADAVGDLSRNVGGVVERVQRLERVKPEEGTYGDLAARIEKLERAGGDRHRVDALKALEKAVAQVAVQFNNTQRASVERLNATERQIQQLAARIDQLGGGAEDASGVGFLKDAIDGLSARIARAERIASEASKLKQEAFAASDPEFVERTGNRLRVLGDEIKRGGDQIRALETTIGKLSEQIEAAERRSSEGVQKVAETIAELREQFSGDSDRDASRADIEAAVSAARQETDERIALLQTSFKDMIGRLESLSADAPKEPAAQEEDRETVGEHAAPFAFDLAEDVAPAGGGDETEDKDETASLADAPEDGENEDPFSFAAEINPLAETTSSEEQDDDFSFELDDDAETQTAGEGTAALSQPQNVFGKKEPPTAPDDKDKEGDLDAMLANLGDAAADLQSAEKDDDGASGPGATARDVGDSAKIMLTDEQPTDERASGSENLAADAPHEEQEDYLKAARRRAREAAQRAADDGKSPRRKLTTKQKAILAARVRKKNKLDDQNEHPGKATASNVESPTAAAEKSTSVSSENEEEERAPGPFAKISAALSSIGRKSSSDSEADDQTDAPLAQAQTDGDRAALATLRATAAARPVTLALGVAIFLAFAALFFLVKDLAFKPEAAVERAAPVLSQPAPAVETPSDAGSGAGSGAGDSSPAASSPVVPEAPTVNPQDLYLEAVAGLDAAETDGDTAAAFDTLQQAAALGHPPAQLQLGELFKTGQGVEQDLGQARTWFRRSANGGNVLAMHRIGVMTARGDGGPADANEAIGWFELAGNRGLVDSQYNLGAIYHPSEDGAASSIQDVSKAYYWYSLAAKNGDEQAEPLAAGVANALSAEQRQELDAAVAAWVAEPSDPDANANALAPTE